MKFLLTVNVLSVIFALSSTEECCAPVLTKAIELYRDFETIQIRGCKDVMINSDTFQMMTKNCIEVMVLDIDYGQLTDLVTEFVQTDCLKHLPVDTCNDDEYAKFKHCAVDFGLAHLEDLLEIYKNRELIVKIYKSLLESKICINKSLDEIETNFYAENIHV